MDKFIIQAKKRQKVSESKDCVVKVTPEAYNALVDIFNESAMSFREVASKAILFAAENVEYRKEEN